MLEMEKSPRGRPATFSREELIETVTEMFWQDGYKSISISKVAKKMGLSRTSLYNSFKTKEDLFLECLDHYAAHSPTLKLRQYQSGQNVGNLLREVLSKICEERAKDPHNRGCLAANIFHELANDKTPIGKKLLEKSKVRKNNMILLIDNAVQQNELPKHTDVETTAYIILSFMSGLNAHAKTGAKEEELKNMCRIFLINTGFKI